MKTKENHAPDNEHAPTCCPFTGQPAPGAITICAPHPAMLQQIADNLCEPDRHDLDALASHDYHRIVVEAVAISREAYVACWDGAPQAVFGVADFIPDTTLGVPWMLSSGTGNKHAREFMVLSRYFIDAWAPMYTTLFNVVGAQHRTAKQWLEALGFVPLATHDVHGHAFIEFGRPNHV